MNFLAIAKLTYNRVGLQGTLDTVEGATGIVADLIQYINDAHLMIQTERDEWKFMQQSTSHALSTLVNVIDGTTVSKWLGVYYLRRPVRFVEYEAFIQNEYQVASPEVYTIVPETNTVEFNELDSNYVVTARSVLQPKELVLNTDTPLLPVRFHRMIAFRAAAGFAEGYLGNAEIADNNWTEYDTLMGQMMRSQNPRKDIKQRPLV